MGKYRKIIFILVKFIIILIFIYFSLLSFFKLLLFESIISVIIPTYNRENLIIKSVKSILNQSYKNIEIILIDDCSNDNTKSKIKKLGDKRIKYIKLKKKSGANYARNIGIKKSKGKYIAFQDSDDIFHYDKLQKQLENLIKYKSDLDFCKIYVHINNTLNYIIPSNNTVNEILKGNIYDTLLTEGNFISTQSILVKKIYIKKYLFDIKFPRLQDFDFILRILPKIKVSFTNEVLVDLFRQKDSISNYKEKLNESISLLLISS